MRPTSLPAIATAACVAALSGAVAHGQASPSFTLDSYRRARDVLMRGIDATGGLDSLRALQDVTVDLRGTRHLRGQSLRADPPYDAPASTGSLVFDARNGRLRWEEQGSFSAGFPFHNLIVTDGRQRFVADLRQRRLTPGGNAALSAHQVFLERLPHHILVDQLDRLATLRWLGETTIGGVRYHVIAGAAPAGPGGPPPVRNFFFDAGTGLLAKFETVNPDAAAGDAVQEVVFADYRKVGPVMIPSRRTARVAGEVVMDHQYVNVRVNSRPHDSLFARPAGLTEAAQAANAPPQTERMTQVAPGIHLLENAAPGYNILVAEFGDHLLVVDAPNNSAVTERAIATIKRTIPGKPIRYVAPTHHHGDHAGGIRAFVAEGATIVTTPGNAALFRRMASSNARTLQPDALSRAPRAPVIETFTGRRVFTDGTRTVELRDIGLGPHAQELLVAYVPAEGIIFQGDLLNAGNDGALVAGNEVTAHFEQWLDRSGLAVRSILGVHSPARTRDELRRAVEMMRTGQ